MDGENSTIYNHGYHARSTNNTDHPSRTWLKQYIPTWMYNLPPGFRVCGEYLYATHSIRYVNLKSYFLVFSIWDEETCLSWEDTLSLCGELKLTPVNVLFRGLVKDVRQLEKAVRIDSDSQEGYVVRRDNSFQYEDFGLSVAKYVRRGHVQADDHWRTNWDPSKINLLE
jgi:hypothetical protein